MRRLKIIAAAAAFLASAALLPVTAQANASMAPGTQAVAGQSTSSVGRSVQPRSICDPTQGGVSCGTGGSDGSGGGSGGGQNGSGDGYDGKVNHDAGYCSGFWDVDGDGIMDYPDLSNHVPPGWSLSDDHCRITSPGGEEYRQIANFNAWMAFDGGAMRRLSDAPPPTACAGYNPSGAWYFGLVFSTNEPQPVWGNPATSAGVCPAPGNDPVQVARDLVASYVETMLSTGELGVTPPEGSTYPASVGVPVRVWFENPIEGETIGTSSPITDTEGTVTVTMDVALEGVTVDWGDGSTSECAYNPESGTVGTPFEEGQDPVAFDSGCQHVYESLSGGQPDDAFTISAVSNWAVTWSVATSGGLAEGVENVQTPASETTVRVGEIQTRR